MGLAQLLVLPVMNVACGTRKICIKKRPKTNRIGNPYRTKEMKNAKPCPFHL